MVGKTPLCPHATLAVQYIQILTRIIVFDLPQLYQKPSSLQLLDVLLSFKRMPRSWNQHDASDSGLERNDTTLNSTEITKYLTGIIASPLQWIPEDEEKELIWTEASARLAERSGRTAMPSMDRGFEIPTSKGSVVISIHEPSLTSDNLGLKTWAASYVLAKRLVEVPLPNSLSNGGLRILELGAGTGLVGIAAAIVLGASVWLTDLADIEPNLSRNMNTNSSLIEFHGGEATAAVLDWNHPEHMHFKDQGEEAVAPSTFPVIVAADSIYSDDHPAMFANAVKSWLSPGGESRLLLELPIRSGYNSELELLRFKLGEAGLRLISEEQDVGYDDWGDDGETGDNVVQCWFSVWGWN
jgi:hypothetical protein